MRLILPLGQSHPLKRIPLLVVRKIGASLKL